MSCSRAALFLLAIACTGKGVDTDGTDPVDTEPVVDMDADGVSPDDGDCDDNDPAIGPHVEEVCNGIDDDCDSVIDVGAVDAVAYFPDADGDGFGSALTLTYACERPDGFIDDDSDCADNDAAVHPNAQEVCNGIDDDCDLLVDDEDTNEAQKWADLGETAPEPLIGNPSTFYFDEDGDGSPGDTTTLEACAPAGGYVDATPDDCDDNDPTRHPLAVDVPGSGIDANCDDLVTCFVDADGDGYGSASTTPHPISDPDCTDTTVAVSGPVSALSDDCNDGESYINPGADEVCGEVLAQTHNIDENCDNRIDDDDPNLVGAPAWYIDQDFDGYGFGTPIFACTAPPGRVDNDGDCDDNSALFNPDQVETCNGADDDCNGVPDDDPLDGTTRWPDVDGDGQGDSSRQERFCTVPTDWIDNGDDCNDDDPTVYLGAPSVPCDGLDNDCDPTTTEAGGVTLDGVAATDLATAVTLASTGAEIELCEGDHVAIALQTPDNLTIRSVGGPDTRIVGQFQDTLFIVGSNRTLTLQDVVLRDGVGRASLDRDGGAIWVSSGGTIQLTDVILRGNAGGHGGAIFLSSSATADLTDVVIENNVANSAAAITPSGGAIYGESNTTVLLNRVDIHNNEALRCGAISLDTNSELIGIESDIRGNESTGLGGGAMCASSGVEISGVEFRNNESANVGGAIVGTTITLTDVRFIGNESGLTGGALNITGVNLLTDVTLEGNSSLTGGGAIDLFAGSVTLIDSSVTLNISDWANRAGGIDALNSTVTSVNTYWGSVATGDRNRPRDIYLSGSATNHNYAGIADFVCDDSTGICQ